MVLPRVFMMVCSRFPLAVVQGHGGFPTCRTRAPRRALKMSCTRAACAAWASVSVRMAGCSCSPSAGARIWSIAKTGHMLVFFSFFFGLASHKRRGLVQRVGCSGGLCRPLPLGDGLQLLPAV